MMKAYVTKFFEYAGCILHQNGNVFSVELSPELAQHFGKTTLRLVFQPEHLEEDTELVTYGSYIANRIYDILKSTGEKISVILPKKRQNDQQTRHAELIPYHCVIKKRLSREVHKTETYLTFRITYYSDEKTEEIVTTGIDFEGNLRVNTEFPYAPASLQDAVPTRFPFTRKQAKEIYARCLHQVSIYAEQHALKQQENLIGHFHTNITRLEAYYQQMMDEIPVLEKDREASVLQLQEEYKLKVADELKKCHIQATIQPVSFCTITVPFRRYRYEFQIQKPGGTAETQLHQACQITVEGYRNLFSGDVWYPRCDSCGTEMKAVGICEVKSHPVCAECLIECHVCGRYVCHDCGIDICAECGNWVCQQCSEPCHICGKRYCTQHLLGCRMCREYFCLQCSEYCELCGNRIEKIHLSTCEICHKHLCPACVVMCGCCQHLVCQSHISFCGFCGQQICSECTFHCEVCGEHFCVHHISQCEITQKMVCPNHVGICENCSRHVSTTCLHLCDVCGKKICTHCSISCHQCGTVFCEDHAGEMLKCPECGEMYCVLCYSSQGMCISCQKHLVGSKQEVVSSR